jgi:hypothetical protein
MLYLVAKSGQHASELTREFVHRLRRGRLALEVEPVSLEVGLL